MLAELMTSLDYCGPAGTPCLQYQAPTLIKDFDIGNMPAQRHVPDTQRTPQFALGLHSRDTVDPVKQICSRDARAAVERPRCALPAVKAVFLKFVLVPLLRVTACGSARLADSPALTIHFRFSEPPPR